MRVALVLTLGAGGVAQANDWVLTGVGDTWQYQDTRFGGDVLVTIDRTSGEWTHFTEFAGLGPLWVRTNPTNNDTWVFKDSNPERLADFDDPVGTTYEITLESCNQGQVVLGGREAVTTPAGLFEDSLRLDLFASCQDGGVTTIWVARGVGVVKWVALNIAGLVEHVLTRATVGGKTFPQRSALNVRHPDL